MSSFLSFSFFSSYSSRSIYYRFALDMWRAADRFLFLLNCMIEMPRTFERKLNNLWGGGGGVRGKAPQQIKTCNAAKKNGCLLDWLIWCGQMLTMADQLIRNMSSLLSNFAVSQHGQCFHAHLQPHLHDAAHWPLVRLSAVSRAHASRISAQFLGGHQRTAGR